MTTSPDDGPSVAKRTMERKSGPVPNKVAVPLPRPHCHVAGDRRAHGEEQRAGHREEPDLGDAVAVDLLHEQREQEEAAEVGEAREALGAHGEHEVAAPPVGRGHQRGGEGRLPPDEHAGQRRRRRHPPTMTPGDVHPAIGPMLRTSMAAVTAPARLQVPDPVHALPDAERSPHRPVRAAVARHRFAAPARARRRTAAARATTTEAMISSTSWPQKSVRHPKNWITGEPSVTPRTGPPAPDQRPPPERLHPVRGREQLEDDRHRRRAGGGALHAVEGSGRTAASRRRARSR